MVCPCRETMPFILIKNDVKKRCEMWKISVKFQIAESSKAKSRNIFFRSFFFYGWKNSRMLDLNLNIEYCDMICPKTTLPSSFDFPVSLLSMANVSESFIQSNPMNSFPVGMRFEKVEFSLLVKGKEDFYLLPYPVFNFIKCENFETIYAI